MDWLRATVKFLRIVLFSGHQDGGLNLAEVGVFIPQQSAICKCYKPGLCFLGKVVCYTFASMPLIWTQALWSRVAPPASMLHAVCLMIFWFTSYNESEKSLRHAPSSESLSPGLLWPLFCPSLHSVVTVVCPASYLHRKFLQDKKRNCLTLPCISGPWTASNKYLLSKLILIYVLTSNDNWGSVTSMK